MSGNTQNWAAAGELIAAWQGLLRLDRFARRHATMRGMFGISELHKRSASGVQAARCSAVPTAKLELEKATRAMARATAPDVT
jgi:hypothetical protein